MRIMKSFLYSGSTEYVTEYSLKGFDRKTVAGIVKAFGNYIDNSGIEFDTIAVRGNSGMMYAPIVCHEFSKELIIVRKSEGHSRNPVEGYSQAKNYIIVDDFVSSGETVHAIHKKIEKFFIENTEGDCPPPLLVGFAFYGISYHNEELKGCNLILYPKCQIGKMDIDIRQKYKDIPSANLLENGGFVLTQCGTLVKYHKPRTEKRKG